MSFDPDAYLADGPATPLAQSAASGSFDPDAYLATADQAGGFNPDEYLQENGGTAKQVLKAATRGALSEGIYAAIEGGSRLGQRFTEKTGFLPNPMFPIPVRKEFPKEMGEYANAVGSVRSAIREALPLDASFAQSKLGQVSQGVGQAVGTLPAYAVPGLGPAASIGMMYDEGYQDAKQAGADDATAHRAAMKYLPASGLDILADRLVVGRILKPLRGKVSVGQVSRDLLVASAAEGATEGGQQLYLNAIAKKLEGYDPERPFDQEVFDSVLVGTLVGGTVTATGQAAGALAAPRETPAPAEQPSGGAAETAEPAATENLLPTAPPAAPPQALEVAAELETAPIRAEEAAAAAEVDSEDIDELSPVMFTRRTADGVFELPAVAPAQPDSGVEPGPGVAPADSTLPVEAQPPEAVAAEVTGQFGAEVVAPAVSKGKRFRLGSRPDGVPDVLDALEQVGGVRPPVRGKDKGGEYDGFREAFGRGAPRLLVRKSGRAVDQVMQEIEELGFRFDSPDAFYAAVQSAADGRRNAVATMRREQDQVAFKSAILANEGRRAADTPSRSVNTDELSVGARFKVRGEPFEVVSINETTGDVVVRDGPRFGTQVLPAGTPVFPDARTLRKPKAEAAPAGAPFARRVRPSDQGQSDMFAGGETGGDTMFNLQGEEAQDFTGAMDQRAELDAAKRAQEQAQQSLFSRRTPEDRAEARSQLDAARIRWRDEARRIAPGLMKRFGLAFGDPRQLVEAGKVRPEELTGWEEAYYDGAERLLYLFDRALGANTDEFTRLNLLHEMGHAHWDTLRPQRQAELAAEWRREMENRSGPLFDGRALKPGVAVGVENDITEWYAERVAWANSEWARGRAGAIGPVERAAANLRELLRKLLQWVAQVRRVRTLDVDFRTFLDQGPLWESPGLVPVGALPSPAFARRDPSVAVKTAIAVSDRMKVAAKNVRGWLRQEFTSRGHLPSEVHLARMEREGRVASIEKQMRFTLRDLDAAVVAVYGGWTAIRADQQQQLNEVLGGRQPVATLDPRLQPVVATMRAHVDALSRRLVSEGVVGGAMAARISGNIGFYLHRSYRKFDDPKWASKVPVEVRNRASAFLRAEMRADVIDQMADREFRESKRLAANAPVDRAADGWKWIRNRLAEDDSIQPDEAKVQGLVEYLLVKDTDDAAGMFEQSGKDGRKDLSILTRRKEIAPEIRALMGEYPDAQVNYARSVAKMAQVLESHRFLTEVRRAGLGRYFFEEPRTSAAGAFVVPVAAEGSRAMAPLNGLFTTKEIADAMQRTFAEQTSGNAAWRAFLALNGWVKVAKTILHPVTQVRNFVANFGFLVANGHWHVEDGGRAVLQAMRAEFTRSDAAARLYLQKLARLGVVGESTAAGEFREALRLAGVKLTGVEQWTDHVVLRWAKMPLQAAARLYQLNDEVFKIYAFENEVRHLRAALPAAPVDQIEAAAAERVRNTLPTYSLVPRFVQRVRTAALVGTFVSFPSEVIRTSYHTLRYALVDLRSANPEIRKLGARRLAGVMAVATVFPAVSAVSRWLNDVDEDEERDLRRFLPEWNRNAMLLYTAKPKRGVYRVVDLSYLDPWAYVRRPILAAMRADNLAEGLWHAGLEASSPFVSEGVLTKVLLDLPRNKKDTGGPVYDPSAAPLEQAQQALSHVWTALEPGVLTQGKRIVKAARGEIDATGRAYNLKDELRALLTGARMSSVDVNQAYHYRIQQLHALAQMASTSYRRVRDRQGTVTPEEIAEARAALERAREWIYGDMAHATAAASRLGIDLGILFIYMRAAGLAERDAGMVLAGYVPPYVERPVPRIELVRRSLVLPATSP